MVSSGYTKRRRRRGKNTLGTSALLSSNGAVDMSLQDELRGLGALLFDDGKRYPVTHKELADRSSYSGSGDDR